MPPPAAEPTAARPGPDWWAVQAAIAWTALLAWTIWYTAANGRNMPMQDEWDFVPVLFGHEDQVEWLFKPHNQHRYVLGRAIYLALHRATGHWFPAGSVLSIGLLAGSAVVLTRTAKWSRGRFHPADALYSIFLLSPAHYETLLMGYQLVFTLTTAALVLVLAVAVRSRDGRPTAAVAAGSMLLVPLVLGGGLGLTFFAPVGAWVGYLAVRAVARDGWLRAGLAFLPAAASLGAGIWFAVDILGRPQTQNLYGPLDTLSHATEFLAVGLGPHQAIMWPPVRWTVSAGEVVVALWLFATAVRSRDERPVALGLLAVLTGVFMTGAAIGHVRPYGFESRYAVVSCLGLCVCVLAVGRYARAPRGVSFAFGLLACGIATGVCYLNADSANYFAWMYHVRHAALKADIRDGVPIGFVADRVAFFPNGYQAANFRLLRDAGFRPLAGIMDDPPLDSVAFPLPTGTNVPSWHTVEGPPPRVELPAPPAPLVTAVRIKYRAHDAVFWQRYYLRWTSADGSVKQQEVFPWLTPGEWSFSFWITDRPTAIWLEPAEPTPGLEIVAVEYFFPAGPPGK